MRTGTIGEALRFATVGLASNGVLYVLYLAARHFGVEHNIAMTMAFVVGVGQTFVANRSWSFRSRTRVTLAFGRYLIVYVLAYLLNLTASIVLVDRLGYEDRLVQAIMVVVIAVLLFGAQKLWVFRCGELKAAAVARGRP
jgi:putative flippase GtrA